MDHFFIETLEFTSNNSTQSNEMEQKLKAVEGSNIHRNEISFI